MLRIPVVSMVLVSALAGAFPAGAQLATGPGLLVTPQWLSQHVKDRDLVILQVGPAGGYRKEHIAGSRFVSLRDIAVPFEAGKLSLEMLPEAGLDAALEKLGISDGSRIVVVADSEWVTPSARVFTTLGYAGLSERTSFLDGGLGAWRKAGLPVTADTTPVVPGHITRHVVPNLIVDFAYVQSHGSAPHSRLLDARAPASFGGAAREQELAGHIPGAANLPWGTLYEDNGTMLGRDSLQKIFRAAGVQAGDTVIAYCHIGQYANGVLLAARVLGHPVKLYDGSFQDWSMRKLPTVGGQ